MDLFLILFVAIITVVAVVVNVRVLTYYQQQEDSGFASSVACKSIIVISLTLAWILNMLLPVDVRNSRPVPGPLNMSLMWEIAFSVLGIFLVLVVPAAMFYTEVEGDDVIKRKRRYVMCNMFLLLFFVVAAIGISYPFLSDAALPVVLYDCNSWQDGLQVLEPAELAGNICSARKDSTIDIKVGFQVYLIAVLCFVGWFFFVIFGGIGLSAVPLDLILSYADRPKAIDEATYQQRRRMLGAVAAKLIGRAEDIQGKDVDLSHQNGFRANRSKRAVRSDYNKFKRDVMLLETEFDKLKVAKFLRGENPVVSIVKLLTGIFCAILSIMWVLHIILCILVPQAAPVQIEFIDGILSACEGSGLYPLGVAIFSAFSLYLLLCVVKGCMKFGMRLFFLFSIHPMKHQGTPLNSILFNVELMLITSAAVVQFTQSAFANYARLTDADVIFSAQIKYLTFYSFFFKNNIFIYLLLTWFLLALIYLLCKPRDNAELRFDKQADNKFNKLLGIGKSDEKEKKSKKDKKEKSSKGGGVEDGASPAAATAPLASG